MRALGAAAWFIRQALAVAPVCAQAVASGPGGQLAHRVQVGSNVAAKLADGSTLYGRVERIDSDSLVVVGSAGRLALPMNNVRELQDAGAAHVRDDGTTEYWHPNPNGTRLFFAPTGRTLGQGEGYFADHEIVAGSLEVGLTDRVTVGGGGLLVPNSDLWFVTPKLGLVSTPDFNLAAGVLLGGVPGSTGGIGYLVGTSGGTDRSVTVGIGNGFSGSKANRQQVFLLGGETRVSRRVSLVTENYFATGESNALVSYGMRFLGERNSVDLAFFNLARSPVFPGIPYVDFVIKF